MVTEADTEESEAGRRRTGQHGARVGGRSERVVRDVLDATLRELARVGYAALRMEDVAADAGVNKTTVYRRWATKADLVTGALRARVPPVDTLPDTGALRSDLLALLRAHVALVSEPEARALVRMMMLEMDHPDLTVAVRALREEKLSTWTTVIRRAVERGELPATSDPRLLVDVLMGSLTSKLRWNEAIGDAYLGAVVDLVLLGALHGGASRR